MDIYTYDCFFFCKISSKKHKFQINQISTLFEWAAYRRGIHFKHYKLFVSRIDNLDFLNLFSFGLTEQVYT